MATKKNKNKPSMRGGVGGGGSSGKHKPGMTRLRTVWITGPSTAQKSSFRDDYVILKQIGEPGQFGKAYQCKRKSDGLILAVKEISKARIYRLHPSDQIRQSLLKSMQAEIDIMRRLKHKYIVNMYGTYETKHTLHIVMEECRGGELFDRIKAKKRYNEIDSLPIIRKVCEALFYMHDQHRVVHCDLKPDNILFVNNTELSDIKIIDFGMSKVLPRLRSLRELCGTPYYTAPEIINGDYTHAADMWSVGVITYVMIFGFPPFYVDPNKYYGVKETKEIYKLILRGFNPIVKKGYGAWFPKSLSSKLSNQGRDFIANLIEKDIAKRMTAKEALIHPWLTTASTTTSTTSTTTPSATNNTDNNDQQTTTDLQGLQFANFATSHKFKFAITALFRDTYKNMRPKHFENLKKLFAELDTDGNGKISYDEFEQGMLKCKDLKLNKNKIQKMFNELDINNLGEIDFENLLSAAIHDYLIASDVRLYQAFRDLDNNETGKIKTDDLKKKIIELNPYGNIDMILQIIDDVDLDNDGTIDYEEFLRALHPDFNETPNWFWTDDANKPQTDDDDDDDDNDDNDDQKTNTPTAAATATTTTTTTSPPSTTATAPATTNNNNNDDDVVDVADNLDQKKDAVIYANAKNLSSSTNKTNNKIKNQTGIAKQGYMQKEGKMIKSWKKRWFILQNNGIMSYYHNQNEDEPISRFSTKNYIKVVNKSWSKSNKKRYGIKLYTKHRNWKFLVKNNEQREAWIKAFKDVAGN